MSQLVSGKIYVVKDNIDTDQIIPAQYLNLVPTIPEEYKKLGSYALCGLPESSYPTRFVPEGRQDTPYTIVVGGRNFGCGSSREHAPIALGAAGCKIVIAESFARIFFRNCVATGELYPLEGYQLPEGRLCDLVKTGDEGVVVLPDDPNEKPTFGFGSVKMTLKPLGDAKPVIDAGGLFNYARKTGMIGKK
jgi:3-isopropylmalate/(R)-2-methylmalate dehydratase small subunit